MTVDFFYLFKNLPMLVFYVLYKLALLNLGD